MKIARVEATWLHVPIPEAQQQVSDFGRMASFDSVLVRVETACGLVGHGEAKEEVGSSANCHALADLVNHKFGPLGVGEDPRDITRIGEKLYNGGYYEADVAKENLFRDELASPAVRIDASGCVSPGDAPGLGVEVNEAFLRAHPAIEGPAYV